MTGKGGGGKQDPARPVPGRPDGLTIAARMQLTVFRARHPGAVIGLNEFGAWEGRIPLPGGGEIFKARREDQGGLPALLKDLAEAAQEHRRQARE